RDAGVRPSALRPGRPAAGCAHGAAPDHRLAPRIRTAAARRPRHSCRPARRTAVTAALLFVLALLDGAFAGFRGSAGLDARIRKRAYNAEAMFWGLLAGVLALGLIGLWVGETLGVANHPVQRFNA